MSYGKDPDDPMAQAQWSPMDRAPVLSDLFPPFTRESLLTIVCIGS